MWMAMKTTTMTRAACLLLLLVALVPMLGGCDESDSEPTAQVRFLHQVADQGTLEVLLGREVVATLRPGELTQREEVRAGDVVLALRSAGALGVLQQRPITLHEDQTHLIAFSGAAGRGTLKTLVVDQPVPQGLQSGQSAVEVVNLLDTPVALDIYVGNTLIAANPEVGSVSEFITVPASSTTVRIFNAGSDPVRQLPAQTSTLSLASRGAVMLVLTGGPQTGLTVTVVPVR